MSARNQATPMPAAPGRSTGDWIKLGGGLAGGGALILFFLQNLQEVSVNFLWFEWNLALIWALLAAAILGAVSSFAFSALRGRGRRREEASNR
jgi:uncharacterized integral membrane protein